MADSPTVSVLSNIFTAPQAAFGVIKERPSPWLPLLVIILVIAAVGLAFSGYLSYRELFASVPMECAPVGEPGTILAEPACVYAFYMYLAIVLMAAFALLRRRTAG